MLQNAPNLNNLLLYRAIKSLLKYTSKRQRSFSSFFKLTHLISIKCIKKKKKKKKNETKNLKELIAICGLLDEIYLGFICCSPKAKVFAYTGFYLNG